jgi:hemoglobin
MTTQDQDSLFNRIGGKAAVNATVDKMYEKILQDPVLQPFFAGLDMAQQRRSQVAFMVMAFGGPHHYTGADLTKAHAKMVKEKGLADKHFDAVAKHLKAALTDLNVPAGLINEVLTLVGTTRAAVLGKTA